MKGRPEYFLTFFMLPFVLVGLGLIGGIVYCPLGLVNPRTMVTVGSTRVRRGDGGPECRRAWKWAPGG